MNARYEWDDDLIWCPSQCYCDVTTPDGSPAVLYLRWRWEDPWQASIVFGVTRGSSLAGWSRDGEWEDIPIEDFSADQLDEAKSALIAAWEASFAS